MQIRKEPQQFTKEDKVIDNAVIQRFADVLDDEFIQTASYPTKAESELCNMGIPYKALTLIRQKDGVVVWRVTTDTTSYVMKCFIKEEYPPRNNKLSNTYIARHPHLENHRLYRMRFIDGGYRTQLLSLRHDPRHKQSADCYIDCPMV